MTRKVSKKAQAKLLMKMSNSCKRKREIRYVRTKDTKCINYEFCQMECESWNDSYCVKCYENGDRHCQMQKCVVCKIVRPSIRLNCKHFYCRVCNHRNFGQSVEYPVFPTTDKTEQEFNQDYLGSENRFLSNKELWMSNVLIVEYIEKVQLYWIELNRVLNNKCVACIIARHH